MEEKTKQARGVVTIEPTAAKAVGSVWNFVQPMF